MPSMQPLSEKISELHSALVRILADVDQMILTLNDPAQRQRLQQIRLNIETALEVAPSFCSCATRLPIICSLTGIPLDPQANALGTLRRSGSITSMLLEVGVQMTPSTRNFVIVRLIVSKVRPR